MNVTQSLRFHASQYSAHRNRVCIMEGERSVTFSQLNKRANQIANAMHGIGIKRGDAVGVLLYNCYEWIEIFHALARIGVAMVPINYRFVPREVEYIMSNSESKALIYGSQFTEIIEQARANFKDVPEKRLIRIGEKGPGQEYESWLSRGSSEEVIVPVDETDVLYLGYTSGTTGFPKGCQFMNGSRLFHALIFAHELNLTGLDRILINMPYYHGNAMFFTAIPIYMGGSAVVMTKFDAENTLATMERYRTTATSMVPTQYERILNLEEGVKSKYDVSSMKKFFCSSSPLFPQIRLAILDLFHEANLYEFYGSAEAGLVSVMRPEDHRKKPNSVGQTALLQQVRLLDDDKKDVSIGEVGELFSRGPMMFGGYYKMPEATEKSMHEGFFSASDMAYMDEDGYIYLTARKKDMIISGGENIYPAEIEQVITLHPAVIEAAVVGVPDKEWDEAPKAFVVRRKGAMVTEAEILEYCKDRLAKYKCPKSVEFLENIPKNPMGKILRTELREKK
jgi:long-chain acyl-CoA synthetase